MNSSGIKRGLAASAISALAVAGLPFIASSASASATALTVASVGPVRDGNGAGGTVVFSVPEGTVIDPADLKLIRSDLTGTAGNQNTANQTISIAGGFAATPEGDEAFGSKTATDEFSIRIAVDTNPTGATADFALFIDDGANPDQVDASELRTPVQITTSGAPTQVVISPDSQTTATTVASPEYTATIRDSAGRLTQATGAEAFAITGTGGAAATPNSLTSAELADGSEKFTATAATGGTKTLTIAGTGVANGVPASVADTATLIVLEQATIDEDEFDLVTGADTWTSTNSFGDTVEVRVDQSAVTFNFVSKDGVDLDSTPDDAGKVILLEVSSATLRFGGELTRTYSVVLDAEGKGSLTINPTGIVAGSELEFEAAGSGITPATTVEFNRAAADSVESTQDVYVTKVGESTSVTVKVLDQFGNPIGAPAQVQLVRAGNGGRTANDGATARVTVGADGTATFNLPDAGTTVGTEDFEINLFEDQFDGVGNPGNPFPGGTINYTADGLGGDFALSDVSVGSIVPLTDAEADAGNESKVLSITGGTPGAPATVTVDNGALILGVDDTLAKATASKTITLDGGGAGSVEIVGTSTGTVTATVVSAGRTKTESLTVTQATGDALLATARNIELEGPANVVAGTTATYTATVTDAFGNPVAGLDDSNVAFQVSGPASLQNKEAATDAAGEIEQTVLLTDNANGSITVRASGVNDSGLLPVVTQFGKAANSVSAANDAPGLSASVDSDSVTSTVTNIAALEQAVADAEEKLVEAQANLAAAQADLDVAQAQLAVAQANVDTLQAKKQNLRQKLNKAKANGNKQKAKTTRKKLRAVKRDLRAAKDALAVATTRVAAQQTVVDIRQGQVDKAQADLDEAQAELDEAQN